MKLLFVYNANSGKLSALLDGLHKMVSPSTYDCNLCAMTFGHFLEDPTWKEFREKSENEMKFYHKDEFLKQFRSKWLPKYNFPVVLFEENGELGVFIDSVELNNLESTPQLIATIKTRQSYY
ncbi:MAG: GTPase [Flavobacteriales bacterium]